MGGLKNVFCALYFIRRVKSRALPTRIGQRFTYQRFETYGTVAQDMIGPWILRLLTDRLYGCWSFWTWKHRSFQLVKAEHYSPLRAHLLQHWHKLNTPLKLIKWCKTKKKKKKQLKRRKTRCINCLMIVFTEILSCFTLHMQLSPTVTQIHLQYVYMRHRQAGFKLVSTFQRLLPTISDKSLAKYYRMPMFT